jgi:hypothetical protein
MNGKQAKKLRRYNNKTINKQMNLLAGSLRQYPRNWFLWIIWIVLAKFYFTDEHIKILKKIRKDG